MATGTSDHLPGASTCTADDTQCRDSLGVAGIVRPVEPLLDHDRGLGPRAILFRLGHPLGRRVDFLHVDLGDLGGLFRLGIVLREKPLLPVFESGSLELAPSRAPLPGRVARALAEPGRGLPLVVDPLLDPLGIFPAVLDDHPGNCQDNRQVGARLDVEVHATVLLSEGNTRRRPRQHKDRLLTALNGGHDEVREQDRLRLVRVRAAHQ